MTLTLSLSSRSLQSNERKEVGITLFPLLLMLPAAYSHQAITAPLPVHTAALWDLEMIPLPQDTFLAPVRKLP